MNWNVFKNDFPNVWDTYFERCRTDYGGKLYIPGSDDPVSSLPPEIYTCFFEACKELEIRLGVDEETPVETAPRSVYERLEVKRDLLPTLNKLITDLSFIAADTATVEISNNMAAIRRVKRGLLRVGKDLKNFKSIINSIKRNLETTRRLKNEQKLEE